MYRTFYVSVSLSLFSDSSLAFKVGIRGRILSSFCSTHRPFLLRCISFGIVLVVDPHAPWPRAAALLPLLSHARSSLPILAPP